MVRLPRHGASCPVGLGVSCSADRQILAKITAEGVFVEQLEHEPAARTARMWGFSSDSSGFEARKHSN